MATLTIVSTASSDTRAKLQRQPITWPIQLARGTPTMVATVNPRNTRPTAMVRRLAGTSELATSDAMPKYAPWGSPLRKRKNSIQ
ncbi:hypothetical protein G6F32_017397 [Rhizopus arrhizus]|nr:hypothetical protein G6F32_017397 [Rhizopus arrhizus]